MISCLIIEKGSGLPLCVKDNSPILSGNICDPRNWNRQTPFRASELYPLMTPETEYYHEHPGVLQSLQFEGSIGPICDSQLNPLTNSMMYGFVFVGHF
jgi:hypothetical protein